jgi:hypothetical protein
MTGHRRLSARIWLPIGIAVVAAGHAMVPFMTSHAALSVGVAIGAAILIVVIHLGLLASVAAALRARLRERFRQ